MYQILVWGAFRQRKECRLSLSPRPPFSGGYGVALNSGLAEMASSSKGVSRKSPG